MVVPTGDANQTYTVSLRSSGPTYASARYSAYPVGRFSNKCICCNAETPYKLEYRPLTTPNVSVGSIRVPRCQECADHVRAPTTNALAEVVGSGVLLTIASIALGFANEAWMAIPGAVGVLVLAMFSAYSVRSRRRVRRSEESLFRNGHYARFSVAVGRSGFTLRTSNPHLRNEFLTLNTR